LLDVLLQRRRYDSFRPRKHSRCARDPMARWVGPFSRLERSRSTSRFRLCHAPRAGLCPPASAVSTRTPRELTAISFASAIARPPKGGGRARAHSSATRATVERARLFVPPSGGSSSSAARCPRDAAAPRRTRQAVRKRRGVASGDTHIPFTDIACSRDGSTSVCVCVSSRWRCC